LPLGDWQTNLARFCFAVDAGCVLSSLKADIAKPRGDAFIGLVSVVAYSDANDAWCGSAKCSAKVGGNIMLFVNPSVGVGITRL
jgi:hypothetical protein